LPTLAAIQPNVTSFTSFCMPLAILRRKHKHSISPNYQTDLCAKFPSLFSTKMSRTNKTTAHKRLMVEYRNLTNDAPDGIIAGPKDEQNYFLWIATFSGPEGTPFEGGIYEAELKFPDDYPLVPPKMRFLDGIWHPNGKYFSYTESKRPRRVAQHVRPILRAAWLLADHGSVFVCSLSQRRSLHIDSAPGGRRPKPLRAGVGAVVADSERREDFD
jgi:ubiquitin-conjugating enzyme E2 G2